MSYKPLHCFATLPRTERGRPIVVGRDPKGKNFLYVNDNSVVIRDIENPAVADIYTEHSRQTTVAQYSPSGFYIASGDVTGKVRIWDTINKEHILKNEFTPLGGAIKDIDWSGDNQRIVVGGDGREKFGHVFSADTGTSVGEVMGHSKQINSVAMRPSRPFKIATASEDNSLSFLEGPPFKYKTRLTDHTRFVNCVRFAPDGSVFISGSADGKSVVYDGKTAEKLRELGNPAHKGGIYALSFSPDSKQVLTASGDKTCKIFDVETGAQVTEFVMGTTVDDMQVSCLWQGSHLLSFSLSGNINYLDQANPAQPSRIIKGHNVGIKAMAISEDGRTIFTGDVKGQICYWDAATGANDIIKGKGHTAQVNYMAFQDNNLITCSVDDTLRITSTVSNEYGADFTKLDSQPKGLAVGQGGLVVVACFEGLVVLRGGRKVFSMKVPYECAGVSIHPGQSEVAVAGHGPDKVYIYSLDGDTLVPKTEKEHRGPVMDVAYSPDGAYLAACNAQRQVQLYTLPNYDTKISSEWCFHTAKVTCLAWSPDSRHLASGGLDCGLIVWDPNNKDKFVQIKAAHPQKAITQVAWLNNNHLVSTADDCCVRVWDITHV